jgi:RNA polymerase sigma factor (TIGR02999 family)
VAVEDQRHRVTEILRDLDLSDARQVESLLAIVYDELRALAARHLRGERRGHTLQPTALVHEAYLRLVDSAALGFDSRAHFFGTAAIAMRRVLVDHARRRNAVKRGGAWERVTLATDLADDSRTATDLLDLHAALERLAGLDPQLARLVELRFFAGLTLDEAATLLGVSRRKAAKDWAAARLWLRRELDAG